MLSGCEWLVQIEEAISFATAEIFAITPKLFQPTGHK